ncbi:MAG TPA: M3 family oligoendopeptidase [Acidimicrobiales bacterium]|nr:M3 family oligoendopeptidase [Acidimicrobiales bacterium]
MVSTSELPHWDLSDLYPSLASREYAAAREAFGAEVVRLEALYDDKEIRGGDRLEVTAQSVAAFEEAIDVTNGVLNQLRTVNAYISSFVTTDARDDGAQAELSGLQKDSSRLGKLRTRLDAYVARFDTTELVNASTIAADHAFPLERAALRASHQMSESEEALASDIALTGSSAWYRMYSDVTARITVPVELADIGMKELPMAQVRALAMEADRGTRKAAYEAEVAGWERWSVPIAAALNSIKGEAATLNERRGFANALETSLLLNNVEAETLAAMQAAVVKSFPDFRRYMDAKANLLGVGDHLAFYDLFAPVTTGADAAIDWHGATDAVQEAFGGYSPALRALAKRALDDRWIDAEIREGKGGGAFCMSVDADRSLVLLNFNGSFDSVQTLAHELGHAYHNTQLANRTPYQRATPMALAETASIFCETVMVEHGLRTADDKARLNILEIDLQGSCQVVVDIHSRFLFEQALSEKRKERALSVAELCALMADAQAQTYGDALSVDHPYMWAAKPHYYGSAFYNWPYTFGLLFGIGLFAAYREDNDKFRAGYDDLLSATGLGSAAALAARFDIDVTSETFWTASLDVIRARIEEFCRLAGATPMMS